MSGFVVLLGTLVVSRILHEKGYRRLDPEQKIRLMDGFSATRAYGLIPLVLLIAAYWLLMSQTEVDKSLLTIAYFASLIAYLGIRAFLTQRKLDQLAMPAPYRNSYTAAQTVSFVGLAWFLFAMLNG
jgi:hypothetical protein